MMFSTGVPAVNINTLVRILHYRYSTLLNMLVSTAIRVLAGMNGLNVMYVMARYMFY
jgi:hypothetical protein